MWEVRDFLNSRGGEVLTKVDTNLRKDKRRLVGRRLAKEGDCLNGRRDTVKKGQKPGRLCLVSKEKNKRPEVAGKKPRTYLTSETSKTGLRGGRAFFFEEVKSHDRTVFRRRPRPAERKGGISCKAR